MTTQTDGATAAPAQDTSLSPNLDVAAFAATQTKPAEAAQPGADGAHKVDAALEGAEKEAADAAAQEAAGEKPFSDLRGMKPDEIEKLLTASPDAAAPAAEGEDGAPAADLDTAAAAAAAGESAGVDADGKKLPTVPIQRLNQETGKRRDAETAATELEKKNQELLDQLQKKDAENNYLKGLAEGRKEAGAGTKPAAATTDPIADIQADLARLSADKEAVVAQAADDFDNGKISMKEFKAKEATIQRNHDKIQATLTGRLRSIHAERAVPDPEVAKEQVLADPRLKSATDDLVAKNPWLAHMTESAGNVLHGLAIQAMEKQGIPNVATPESTWQLRRLMAQVGKELGYDRIQVPAATKAPAAPASTQVQQPTAEQRAAKLDLANKQPPAFNVGGGAALPNDAMAGLNVDAASVADLSRLLPKASFEKLLGLTS